MSGLNRAFFRRPTLEVAPDLLGAKIWTRTRGKLTSGMIVEVEAYRQHEDAASHCYRGETARNRVMFREGGHCYVYMIYGLHYCMNVVTEGEGVGAALLLRAIQPLEGIDRMSERRGGISGHEMTNGPAKLCRALGVTPRLQGEDLLRSERIGLERHLSVPRADIGVSTRIGISKAIDLEWRFFIAGNPWVSRGRPAGDARPNLGKLRGPRAGK